jgi:hypothetical protein
MRPAGASGTHLPPLLALVLERSPAGEEARLLFFCAVLVQGVLLSPTSVFLFEYAFPLATDLESYFLVIN